MADFVITSYDNSFSVSKDGQSKEYQRGVLGIDLDPNNDKIIDLNTTLNRDSLYRINLDEDSLDINGSTSWANSTLVQDALRPFFFRSSSGGGGGGSLEISPTPPSNTSLLWFNTVDSEIYFYDGADWVTSQIYEFIFNDQGSTPNNTWLRMGNTVSNNLGIGFYLDYDVKITGLSFNRAPNTTQVGFYDLYSNTLNIASDTAAVVGSYLTDLSARGFIEFPQQSPSSLLELNAGCYISLRWRGNQTNNNVTNIQYRKKYV